MLSIKTANSSIKRFPRGNYQFFTLIFSKYFNTIHWKPLLQIWMRYSGTDSRNIQWCNTSKIIWRNVYICAVFYEQLSSDRLCDGEVVLLSHQHTDVQTLGIKINSLLVSVEINVSFFNPELDKLCVSGDYYVEPIHSWGYGCIF